jgi:LmbE family N-acetylglucosaminyl deacetylase
MRRSGGWAVLSFRHATVVTVTDGAPRQPERELKRLRVARGLRATTPRGAAGRAGGGGDSGERSRALNVVDQEASLEMAYLTMRLVDVLRELRPSAVLTHPYEGGHPDHDATAFAVHAACARVASPPDVFEFASYHAASGEAAVIEAGRFLPDSAEVETVPLSDGARARKSEMIERYRSQLHMLRHWPLDVECYRAAPVYDFTQAPHEGTLYYEHFDWGVTGDRWRLLAGEALRTLGAATPDL